MNETQTQTKPGSEKAAHKASAFVDALFDVGATWAETGIGLGRVALQNSAEALTRTAKALEVLEEKFRRSNRPADADPVTAKPAAIEPSSEN